LFFIILIIY